MDDSPLKPILSELFEAQRFAVLATHENGQPYTSLMAFAATPDLKALIVATERNTRKYANLSADSRVSFLIDQRPASESALIEQAIAVTVLGRATEVPPEQRDGPQSLLLARHPYLGDFLADPSCALIETEVESYLLARLSGEIRVWEPAKTGGGQ